MQASPSYVTARSPRCIVTWLPLGLRHWSRSSFTCTAALWFFSIHWNEKESGPPPTGVKLARPGLLYSVWLPTFVLFRRNSTGAPVSTALAFTTMGNTELGSSLMPGTSVNVVDVVETASVRHTVSMHFAGVVPPFVAACAAHTPPTATIAAASTLATLRICAPPSVTVLLGARSP